MLEITPLDGITDSEDGTVRDTASTTYGNNNGLALCDERVYSLSGANSAFVSLT